MWLMEDTTRSISTINFADYNPRIMKEHSDGALGNSLDKFGDISGITNNMPAPGINNLVQSRLVTGHQRIRKLREKYGDGQVQIFIEQRYAAPDQVGTIAIGYVGVPGTSVRFAYREVMWPEGLEMAANIAANTITGENDDEKLAKLDYEIAQMENGSELLELTGQSDRQLKRLLAEAGVVDGEGEEEAQKADPDAPEKLEFALTRDHRLIIERALEHVKAHRELQAISSASLNGAALFVMASDYLAANPEPEQPTGELTGIPGEAPLQPSI
jgi:hypothetical protein